MSGIEVLIWAVFTYSISVKFFHKYEFYLNLKSHWLTHSLTLSLMDLHILRSPEFENHISRGCVWSCYYISITQKQIIGEIPNLVSYVRITCINYLKPFIKIGQRLYIGVHKIILIHYGLRTEFHISEFQCI